MANITFLPEWVAQDAVMLAWPHATTDWAPWLGEIDASYVALVKAIAQAAPPLILCQDSEHQQHIQSLLGTVNGHAPLWELGVYNDTWCRDYGPLTLGACANDGVKALSLLDFQFSGWGDKYEASDDNAVNQRLAHQNRWKLPLDTVAIELEGGSVESDGQGTLMTTEACLLGGNRNEDISQQALEAIMKDKFHVERILWIKNGYLCGDDTDSHVDNLVRFASADTLVYASCDRTDDEHFVPLEAMREELEPLKTLHGKPYRLIPLQIPEQQFDENGKRLPASYVNFLIVNQHLIVPQFDSPYDALALAQLREAFPGYILLPIPGKGLIKQYGGPHCATMQLPVGTVNV